MKIEMIAFDADDTLWYAERYYQAAQKELEVLLQPWEKPEKTGEILYEIEMRNVPVYGYGAKSFILSMIEAAIRISRGQIQASGIEQILALGRSMLAQEVHLRPQVEKVIPALAESFPLMVITKGDLLDQTGKVGRSGLADHFTLVEVVNEKAPAIYREVFKKYRIKPQHLLMVGNSLKSDVLPILELGGSAVHIPAETTWKMERVTRFEPPENGFYELAHMGELPGLIDRITLRK